MHVGDLNTPAAKMFLALKLLRERWADTKEVWRDANSLAFEENYIAPLEPQVVTTLEALSRLAEVLQHAQHECE